MSEREGSQRERGAGSGMSEREGSQRERGATRAEPAEGRGRVSPRSGR
jgi:hypothetical protein